ncbi:MAG: hypothetical protein A3I61_19785 [Acidobacteria bacterium RIFCSPLOWO2_02_FULL_68_18]|nr:MAG: hypothetical protein A3I61_19785 [Acidobacteria bacterium RIFCSPLOWO2_02_FULL_68_18]OFW48293.1 MAG: hypothetical protein A3G77_03350 [Acidobacteria bacterium RIFCSPLOWO2_12_FULL_68_19]
MIEEVAPVEFTILVGVACAVLLTLGVALAAYLPRVAGFEAPLRRVLVALYGLRVVTALVVFGLSVAYASTSESPAAGPGLWRGIPDAIGYHNSGMEQADAAVRGVRLREAGLYPLVVGLAYTHIGRNPLPLILLNGVLDVVTLVLLLVLARRLSGRSSPPWLAWALGLWPSWIGWSVQPLKEPLLLCASAGALAVMVSVVARESASREFHWRTLLWWPPFVFILACIGLLRGADVYVFIGALTLTAVWLFLAAYRGLTPWRAAVATAAIVVVLPQARTTTERLIAPSTPLERSRAWFEMGRIYEKEGAIPRAQRAYRVALSFSPDDGDAEERLFAIGGTRELAPSGAAPGATPFNLAAQSAAARSPSPAVPDFLPGRLRRLVALLDLRTLADLRAHHTSTNDPGHTRFGQDADLSTPSGLLQFLPIALAHVLFAPFPAALVPGADAGRAFGLVGLLELPWMYAIAVLGFVGAFVCCRSGRIESVAITTYVTLGVLALALIVDHDGLLFRYRLQFMVPLALFLPAAFELGPLRAFVRRSHE